MKQAMTEEDTHVTGYFAEDYTFIGGANDAYVRVTAIDTAGIPTAFTVINPGSTFLNATADILLTSPRGETNNSYNYNRLPF